MAVGQYWKDCEMSSRTPRSDAFVEQFMRLLADHALILGNSEGDTIYFAASDDIVGINVGDFSAKGRFRSLLIRFRAFAFRHGANDCSPYDGRVTAAFVDSDGDRLDYEFDFWNRASKPRFSLRRFERLK